ncbi:hypothetical protein ACHAWO_007183 [Cyclotella atomus]|uniref:Uncharacterized protein n=1 Tax=Cyclotella atomus TaxID=382360 RepID=A0ABD3N459_9STRA
MARSSPRKRSRSTVVKSIDDPVIFITPRELDFSASSWWMVGVTMTMCHSSRETFYESSWLGFADGSQGAQSVSPVFSREAPSRLGCVSIAKLFG